MIEYYNFDKNIKKSGSNYIIEINIPNKFNNFYYKIFGNKGFYQYGKYIINKNNNTDNIFIITLDEIQIICFSIILNKSNKNDEEYFDFYNLYDILNDEKKKNIEINIIKKNIDNNLIHEIDNKTSNDNNFYIMQKNSSNSDAINDANNDANNDQDNDPNNDPNNDPDNDPDNDTDSDDSDDNSENDSDEESDSDKDDELNKNDDSDEDSKKSIVEEHNNDIEDEKFNVISFN
jgi:hypothetical protein